MMTFINPEDHNQKSSPMPFWIRFEEGVNNDQLNTIKKNISNILGEGSALMFHKQDWSYRFIEGKLVLMFRTAEDRLLAKVAL